MSKDRVLVIGLPFYGVRVAESLRGLGFVATYAPNPGRRLRAWPALVKQILRADIIYAIGSSARRYSPLDLMARRVRPVLMHWVGSDVQYAAADRRAGKLSRRLVRRSMHRADAPWLVDELRAIGIRAQERLLPIPIALGAPGPLPAVFRVLVYLPREPHQAYDVESTIEVFRRLPGVQFAVAGGFSLSEPLPNVECLGFVEDMPAVYRNSVAMLRLMRHDGMSHSVLEAASFGRHVLWSYPFAGSTLVSGVDEAVSAIGKLQRQFDGGELGPAEDAAALVLERYNTAKVLADIASDLGRLQP